MRPPAGTSVCGRGPRTASRSERRADQRRHLLADAPDEADRVAAVVAAENEAVETVLDGEALDLVGPGGGIAVRREVAQAADVARVAPRAPRRLVDAGLALVDLLDRQPGHARQPAVGEAARDRQHPRA